MFTTQHVHRLFDVTAQTVRNWADEFAAYLSPTAVTQGSGGWRKFTADDLTVFALVKELSEKGRHYSDIHATLKTGQRGEIPDISSAQLNALLVGDVERDLARELTKKQDEIDGLREEVESLEVRLSERDLDVARLGTLNLELRKRILQLEGQLKTAVEKGEAKSEQANFYRGQLEMLKMMLQKKRS